MIDELRYLDLTDTEIKIYEALLELGETTTGPICKKTQKQNSTVYYCLKTLEEKGLVTHVVKGKTKHYRSVDPDLLVSKIDEQIKEKQRQKQKLEQKIPDLIALQDTAETANTTVYEGKQGFKTWLKSQQRNASQTSRYYTYVVENAFVLEPAIRRQLHEHNKVLHEEGTKPKLLFSENINTVSNEHIHMDGHADIRYADKSLPAGTVITDETMTIIVKDSQGIHCFVLTNEALADSYAAHFEIMWSDANPLTQ